MYLGVSRSNNVYYKNVDHVSDGTFVAHDYCDPDLSVLKTLSDEDKRRVVKVHMDYLMGKVVSHLVQDFFDTHR